MANKVTGVRRRCSSDPTPVWRLVWSGVRKRCVEVVGFLLLARGRRRVRGRTFGASRVADKLAWTRRRRLDGVHEPAGNSLDPLCVRTASTSEMLQHCSSKVSETKQCQLHFVCTKKPNLSITYMSGVGKSLAVACGRNLFMLSTLDGSQLSCLEMGGEIRAPPSIDPWNSHFWVTSHSGCVCTLDSRGSLVWEKDVGSAISTATVFSAGQFLH